MTGTNGLVTRKIGVNMTYFKHLDQEIRELDFAGMSVQAIADHVGLTVRQVLDILDEIEDPMYYADVAADLDAEHYGNI
jgi:hypothetical protein